MNRSSTPLLLAALALLLPLASAAPPAPGYPTVRECSEFQVDWNHCAGYLLCVSASWGKVEASECVRNPCSPGVSCTIPCDRGCVQPDVWTCSGSLKPVEERCEGYLLCAQVEWDPLFSTSTFCVEDCPALGCLACPTGSSWCEAPYVRTCSEFMVDWNHCAGMLVCAWGGYQDVELRRVCVPNPCTPGLAACFSCDISCTAYSECHQDVGTTYGSVGCTGVLGPLTYHCVTRCPPYVQLVDCTQDTTGRVECSPPPRGA